MNKNKRKEEKEENKTILHSSEIRRLESTFFGYRLGKKDDKGLENDQTLTSGPLRKWSPNDSIEYLVPMNRNERPLVSVMTTKVLRLLLQYTVEQWGRFDDGKIGARFTKERLLKDLGYSQEDIRKGGKRYVTIEKVLRTLAFTFYRQIVPTEDSKKVRVKYRPFIWMDQIVPKAMLEKVQKRESQEGIIENGYFKGRGVEYQIEFTADYHQALYDLKEKRGGKFSVVHKKIIADKSLNNNIQLFKLLDYIEFTTGGATTPVVIRSLLERMRVKKNYINQVPSKCYDALFSNIYEASQKYPELFIGITLHSDKNKLYQKFGFKEIEIAKSYSYNDFKDTILKPLFCDDIRNCKIAFHQRKKNLPVFKTQGRREERVENKLEREITKWVDDNINYSKMKKFTQESTHEVIRKAIEISGENTIFNAFRFELQKPKPNAVHFCSKTLTKLIRQYRKPREKKLNKEGVTSIKTILKNRYDSQ